MCEGVARALLEAVGLAAEVCGRFVGPETGHFADSGRVRLPYLVPCGCFLRNPAAVPLPSDALSPRPEAVFAYWPLTVVFLAGVVTAVTTLA